MACFVTGITPTGDISALEEMLGRVQGIDRTKLIVITLAKQTSEHESSFLNFVHAGGGYIDSDTAGSLAGGDSGIMTTSGGTGVPGMSTRATNLASFGGMHPELHLGNLPIPQDQIENYTDALAEGRCIVAYECPADDASALVQAFRDAGVRRVKTYVG